jgi:hypothetical protein
LENKVIKPIFILSLPRTGSTLLQRVLASHARISTTPESWILLNLLYSLNPQGIIAEYSQISAERAMQGLITDLPNGEDDYLAVIRTAVLSIYEKLADEGSEYFLDKTPRYHLIPERIIQVFPDAKIIVLWRHPLAVVASMLNFRPPWNLYDWYIDLYRGFDNLFEFGQGHATAILSIRYEDFVSEPIVSMQRIHEFLGLEYSEEDIRIDTQPQLAGRMGDHTDFHEGVSKDSLDKWKTILNNPVRIWWCKRYLKYLGAERLKAIGYDYDEIDRELSNLKITVKHSGIDLVKILYGYVHSFINMAALRTKMNNIKNGIRIYPYS